MVTVLCSQAARLLLLAVSFAVVTLELANERWLIAQEPASYKLVIHGDELQNCIVSVRYFRNRQLTKTVVTRSTLVGGYAEESLESQHEGIEVYLQSAEVPLVARVLGKDEVLAEGNADDSGTVKLSLGKVGRAPFQPIPLALTRKEASVVEAISKAMAAGTSLIGPISDSPNANLDGPCFDVFLREVKALIGPPIESESSVKGWLGYGNPEKVRTLLGVIRCQDGVCGLKIALEKDRIIDIVPNCPALPDNYFREPINVQTYTRQARLLTQSLFAGNSKRAHELYSPKFQTQITTDQLAQLSDVVHQRYGKSLKTIDFKRSQLLDYNFEQQSSLLNIDLLLQTDTGARCISRTTFSIPSGRNQIGRAHLGAVNIFQVFQSAHPQLAQTTEELLLQLSQGMQASALVQLYPQELRQLANVDETQALLNRIDRFLSGNKPAIDFDTWTATGSQELTIATGPVVFGSLDCFVEIQFNSQSQVLGFSFYGPALSESTLGLFDFDQRLQQASEKFWELLLRDNAESAYSMLHPEFQSQFSLEELKAQLELPQGEEASLKSLTTDFIRLSVNPFRASPNIVAVFLTANFEQGMQLPLTCELPLKIPEEDLSGAIYDFSNEFEMDFPVSEIPIEGSPKDGLKGLAQALVDQDRSALLALIAPPSRSGVDRSALDAYMKKLKEIGGEMSISESSSRTVEFSPGQKWFRCNAILLSQNAESLPIEGWFRNGYLERFSVSDSRLIDFVSLLDNTGEIERRILEFSSIWLKGEEAYSTYLLPSMDSEAMRSTLATLREAFTTNHGEIKSVQIASKLPYKGGSSLLFEVTLTGVQSTKTVTVSVEVGAFGGLISGVTF